jgi:antitoxin (DNA-binding transcriptional repressor) of toxin-antitoxin stability system
MQLTSSQLQSKHKTLIEALKRGERVEITYHGQILGVVHPVTQTINSNEQQVAMNAFFGMHSDLEVEAVDAELRSIRKGRAKAFNDL